MKKRIDWLNHSLEFFVVLIGILIAFQLNECSDNRSKKELIDNHLTQIKYECKQNKKIIVNSIERTSTHIQNCDELLKKISTKSKPETIRNIATTLLDLRAVDISKNAYNVLVQSGDIRYLDNYITKRNIISLYDDFKDIDEINQSIRNLYDTHYYPYIKSNFDLVNWNTIRAESADEKKLYYSKEFANTVSTYRYLLLARKRIYSTQEKALSTFLNE